MRFLKFLLAASALPLAWALSRVFVDVLRAIPSVPGSILPPEIWALFAGFITHFIAWLAQFRPVRAYVLGHELTHAAVALCFGARVSNLRVTARGGSVSVSKSNTLITLAPYFVPFYTIIIVLSAIITRLAAGELPAPTVWIFAVGFSWCFHLCFTIRSVLQEQPDIRECGFLFSYVLIWICNVVGVSVWLVGTAGISWQTLFKSMLTRTTCAYSAVFHTFGSWFTALGSW